MTLVALFMLFFVGGPLGFYVLTAGDQTEGNQRMLGAATLLCAASGLVLRYGVVDIWGRNLGITLVALALFWIAWVGVLAYGARALRRIDGGLPMRRWTGVIGAAGTTAPWFGLASANLING